MGTCSFRDNLAGPVVDAAELDDVGLAQPGLVGQQHGARNMPGGEFLFRAHIQDDVAASIMSIA